MQPTGVLSLLALSSLSACAANFATLDFSTVSPSVVEVDVDSTGTGKFNLIVKNLSDQPLILHPDQVMLQTTKGDRMPLAPPQGGQASEQVVQPGTKQPITVRYVTKDLTNDTVVLVRFDKAFTQGNTYAVPPRPLEFKVGAENDN